MGAVLECECVKRDHGQVALSGPTPLGFCKAMPREFTQLADGRKAIKFVARRTGDRFDGEREDSIRNEVYILNHLKRSALNSLNSSGFDLILELIDGSKAGVTPAWMKVELIEPFGFDMFCLIQKHAWMIPISIHEVAFFIDQLCQALSFLQRCHVVHGDLKCENVLVKRDASIKLIDFGMATITGKPRMFPMARNIAPEVRGKRATANLSQDMFGMGWVLRGLCSSINTESNVQVTQHKLLEKSPEKRMTLETLKAERWLRDKALETRLQSTEPSSDTLVLMPGFLLKVDSAMLAHGTTIGSARIGESGAQVLYIRRGDFKDFRGEDHVIRVPNASTELFVGDYVYLGLKDVAQREQVKMFMDLEQDARKPILDDGPECESTAFNSMPIWLTFDKIKVPHFVDGYVLGPPPDSPDANDYTREKYQHLDPHPSGYLNMRKNFNINLAGVMHSDGQICFFPGVDFVLHVGDSMLLARMMELDGSTTQCHTEEVLSVFLKKDLFNEHIRTRALSLHLPA